MKTINEIVKQMLDTHGGVPANPKIDYTNKIFGKWRVLGYPTRDSKDKVFWLCECQCGNKTLKMVDRSSLKNGSSTSCGCARKGLKKKYNKYDLSGEYGIGIANNTGNEFLFDKEDYDLIREYCWYEGSHGYMYSTLRNDGVGCLLHKKVTNTVSEEVIDYKNRNKLDCRKKNLRICSMSQNNMNRTIMSSNTSGNTGVCWDSSRNKWCSEIMVEYKKIYLGRFDKVEDAVQARIEAELKYFGDYANLDRYDNHDKED